MNHCKLPHLYDEIINSLNRFSQSDGWWSREFISDYVPVITWDTPSVEQFLNGQNYLSGVSTCIYSIVGSVSQEILPVGFTPQVSFCEIKKNISLTTCILLQPAIQNYVCEVIQTLFYKCYTIRGSFRRFPETPFGLDSYAKITQTLKFTFLRFFCKENQLTAD